VTIMIKRSSFRSDEWALPFLWTVGAVAALCGCFWLLVVYLSQPTVYPNPGLATYTPPPGTRLLPLPRKMDAPEVGDLAGDPPSPVNAVAQAQTNEKRAKSASAAVRKRTRVIPREHDEPALGYAQQWNGYGGWNGNRTWNAGRKLSGDPKPWF
jgi:hypothetical protein